VRADEPLVRSRNRPECHSAVVHGSGAPRVRNATPARCILFAAESKL
jgi:hypothetical protein